MEVVGTIGRRLTMVAKQLKMMAKQLKVAKQLKMDLLSSAC